MYISSTIIKITIKADIFSFKVVFLISKLIFDFPIFISFLIFLCYNGCRWRMTIPQTCFLFGKLYYNAENKQVDCDCYFFYFQHFFIFLCHYNLFNSFLDISILYFNSELLPLLEAGASWEVPAFASQIYLPSSSDSPCPVFLFS